MAPVSLFQSRANGVEALTLLNKDQMWATEQTSAADVPKLWGGTTVSSELAGRFQQWNIIWKPAIVYPPRSVCFGRLLQNSALACSAFFQRLCIGLRVQAAAALDIYRMFKQSLRPLYSRYIPNPEVLRTPAACSIWENEQTHTKAPKESLGEFLGTLLLIILSQHGQQKRVGSTWIAVQKNTKRVCGIL